MQYDVDAACPETKEKKEKQLNQTPRHYSLAEKTSLAERAIATCNYFNSPLNCAQKSLMQPSFMRYRQLCLQFGRLLSQQRRSSNQNGHPGLIVCFLSGSSHRQTRPPFSAAVSEIGFRRRLLIKNKNENPEAAV
jgi:hypothetical protein